MESFLSFNEDLRQWFSKNHPKGDWKRINSKGEVVGPCAREPGEPKPKCMSKEKRAELSKKERAAAVAQKRKHDPNPERKGEPINVSNYGKGKISEDMENLEEKNVPTNPELWSRAKALARSKFDVYPSAYANGWAAKWYKGKGGSWKTVSEEKGKTFRQIRQMCNEVLGPENDIGTKALTRKLMKLTPGQESNLKHVQESGGPVVYKSGEDHIEKYSDNSFAVYKKGMKKTFYSSLDAAKEALKEEDGKTLNKPFLTPGGPKKRSVYVKDPSTGNVKKVNFGDPNMTIKKNIPARRKSFRARHNCETPGPKTKARYWSCKAW